MRKSRYSEEQIAMDRKVASSRGPGLNGGDFTSLRAPTEVGR
jgi:hypothetical protein